MKRILALILSSVYCGLGQVYKGEVLKGVNFAIVYSALILSLIFLSSVSQFAQVILVILLVIMWLTGMMDAYADEKTFIEGNHGLLWKTLIMVLIAIGISGSIFTVAALIVYPQIFTSGLGDVSTHVTMDSKTEDLSQQKLIIETDKSELSLQDNMPKINTSNVGISGDIEGNSVQINNSKSITSAEVNKSAGSGKAKYYTIQVGAFSESDRAEELAKQLKEKGYSVSVISPSPDENSPLYKVYVGKFDNKDGATKIAKKLNEYDDINGVVIPLGQSN